MPWSRMSLAITLYRWGFPTWISWMPTASPLRPTLASFCLKKASHEAGPDALSPNPRRFPLTPAAWIFWSCPMALSVRTTLTWCSERSIGCWSLRAGWCCLVSIPGVCGAFAIIYGGSSLGCHSQLSRKCPSRGSRIGSNCCHLISIVVDLDAMCRHVARKNGFSGMPSWRRRGIVGGQFVAQSMSSLLSKKWRACG